MKKVVHYTGTYKVLDNGRAVVHPVDHPDTARVSNRREAMTSLVVHIGEDGVFETQNTIYRPVSSTHNLSR